MRGSGCCFQKCEESSPSLRGLFTLTRYCNSSEKIRPGGFLTPIRKEAGEEKSKLELSCLQCREDGSKSPLNTALGHAVSAQPQGLPGKQGEL